VRDPDEAIGGTQRNDHLGRAGEEGDDAFGMVAHAEILRFAQDDGLFIRDPAILRLIMLTRRSLTLPVLALFAIFAALSAEVLYLLLKPIFQRERPRIIERLAEAGWYSYPSGHAMLAPVIYGFGLILLAQSVRDRRIRAALVTLALTLPPLIAISRVYLGVHYPSDVVAALFLGNAWMLLWSEVRTGDPSLRSG
jgi:undecaprenyl-diphosphatase